MYFANMFCYDSSTDATVGITGIRGCMGIIYFGSRPYAIHIPPTKDEDHKTAREVFEQYIKNQEGGVLAKKSGYLFALVNGANRTEAEDEISDMRKRLNRPPTTIYRIMKNLGGNSGGKQAESVAIMMELSQPTKAVKSGVFGKYMRNDSVEWVDSGDHEVGQYKKNSAYLGNGRPKDFAGWHLLDKASCKIKVL